MSRRLLGYVVKLPDGTRSPRTPKPASLANIVLSWCSGRAAEPLVVVPVFAVRKPVVVPTQITTEAEARAFNALEPKPAPVVAGERYACWAGVCMWLTDGEDDPRDTGTRAEAEARAAGIPGAKVVRILADGEHEAAVAKAREEGAEGAISYIALRVAKAAETGDVSTEAAEEFDDIVAAYRLKAEAAKGCAE